MENGLNIFSDARSGCGMSPKTFLSILHIPAIESMEPFGFPIFVKLPCLSTYLRTI